MSAAKPNSATNPKVDAFLTRAGQWRAEFEALRAIALACQLTEELKWGQPCYTLDGRNVVLMHGFKDYCALLFFKGALMKDPKGILVQQTRNVQAARQIRFTGAADVDKHKAAVKAYIREAMAVEQSGATVDFKETEAFEVPAEFTARLAKQPALKKAFAALTPGRQRAWLLHFGSAKQAATREGRIDKATPLILAGKGPMDKG